MTAATAIHRARIVDAACMLVMALACAACSSRPSTASIRDVFASRLDQPGCAGSVMFKRFPVTLSGAADGIGPDNARTFDAFVAAGLLSRSGNTYSLSAAGRAAYKADEQGFCYSDGYEIRKIAKVEEIPDAQSSPDFDKGWFVTLDIAQKPVAAWARTPTVSVLALDRKALSSEPQTYHVTLAHARGKDGIEIDDPMFMLPHGFDVSDGI